ncbi:MAG: P-loop NTPase [Actinomycetes bacterium]
MEPLDYVRVLLRRWRVVLACLLLSGAGAALVLPEAPAEQAPTFSTWAATATLLREPDSTANLAYTRLLMTRGELPARVAEVLGTGESGPALAARVDVAVDDAVGTIGITAVGSAPEEVERVVNTYAEQTIAWFDGQAAAAAQADLAALQQRLDQLAAALVELDEQVSDDPDDSLLRARQESTRTQYEAVLSQRGALLHSAEPVYGLRVLEAGEALEQGVRGIAPPANPTHRLLLGMIAGGLLGAVLALALDRFDVRLRDRGEVQALLGAPVIGEVRRLSRHERHSDVLPVVADPGSDVAEAYRGVRSALTLLPARSLAPADGGQQVVHEPPTRALLVVSARAAEGKSTTVANLAATIAAAGRSVIVVDGDLHGPSLGRRLGVPPGRGLADLTAAQPHVPVAEVSALLTDTRVPGVRLLNAGSPEHFASVNPARMPDVLKDLRALADVVVVDVAPLLTSSDALDLMRDVDSVLVVCRVGRTTRDQLAHLAEVLGRTKVPVLGAVLVASGSRRPALLSRGSESIGRKAFASRDVGGRTGVPVLPSPLPPTDGGA